MYRLNYQNNGLTAVAVTLPSSKSISNRALILNALLGNQVILNNISNADDTQLMLSALESNEQELYLDNAGTCMRFLTAYFACLPGKSTTLLGSHRMELRPIDDLVNALQQLGAKIQYLKVNNYPPILINGSLLQSNTLTINASKSSQFITALMLIGPFLPSAITIHLSGNIASFNYIKMTALLMNKWGFEVQLFDHKIMIAPFSKLLSVQNYSIENDWSGAAFWYLVAVIKPHIAITINQLSLESIQGDSVTAAIFKILGVNTKSENNDLVIQKTSNSQDNLIFNLLNSIDLAPALCVACAVLNINTTITGLQNLAIKESNRIEAIVTELNKLGYNLSQNSDTIFIKQTNSIDFTIDCIIDTYNDHRIAMAFAPLAFLFSNIKLNDILVVSKSYPLFFDELTKFGIITINDLNSPKQ